jgi:hypothetical protein
LTPHDQAPALPRRSKRARTAPKTHNDYIPSEFLESFIGSIEEGGEPLNFAQAVSDPRWVSTMTSELKSLLKNHTWDLVPLPPSTRPISAQWIFKRKPGHDGQPDILKAQVVAWGFEQHHGVDFQETFAPTVRWESIRFATALAAHHGWPIYHMDVVTAFLNGTLHEDVYMSQPPGCIQPGTDRIAMQRGDDEAPERSATRPPRVCETSTLTTLGQDPIRK